MLLHQTAYAALRPLVKSGVGTGRRPEDFTTKSTKSTKIREPEEPESR